MVKTFSYCEFHISQCLEICVNAVVVAPFIIILAEATANKIKVVTIEVEAS